MRVVLDTNVVVAAIRSPTGASAEVLRRIREGRLVPSVSVALCLEYEAVALRPEHVSAAGASLSEIRNVLDVLIALSEPVEIAFRWRPQLRDPGDDLVLEAAANGQAAAIITFNEHDFRPECDRFGIEAIAPGDLLRRLR
jgi:putative PIN family toxin of toxin-antitoxin system